MLTQRLQQCIAKRQQLPNTVAVNFTSQGDLFKTVNLYNAAIARQSGVTPIVTKAVKQLRDREGITDSELRELNALHRLPKISAATARKLLGPLADRIPTPRALRTFASPCPDGTHAASKKELKAREAGGQGSRDQHDVHHDDHDDDHARDHAARRPATTAPEPTTTTRSPRAPCTKAAPPTDSISPSRPRRAGVPGSCVRR